MYRRTLLSYLTVGSGLLVLPDAVKASNLEGKDMQERIMLPDEQERGSELFWQRVKEHYSLKPGLVMLNAANLCPSAKVTTERLFELTLDLDGDPSFENREKYEAHRELTRMSLSKFLKVDNDEIALVRNTTEANRTVIDGLELGKGDEVVLWDQNHESNSLSWDVWSRRYGFVVKRVSTPVTPASEEDLLAPFIEALTPRTRVLSFSHVSNLSGIKLPAEKLCRMARERGALSLVDGAQSFGMMPLDLHSMGCDFFTGSAHKWLCGPRETGVLYVRREQVDGLWPSMVTHLWEKHEKAGARKFDNLGQQDDGRIAALAEAIQFQQEIGASRIEQRIRQLVARLIEGLDEALPSVRFVTPRPAVLNAGIVIIATTNDEPKAEKIMGRLYKDFNIAATAADVGGRTLVRFSPHIYNSLDDIDHAIEAMKAII